MLVIGLVCVLSFGIVVMWLLLILNVLVLLCFISVVVVLVCSVLVI